MFSRNATDTSLMPRNALCLLFVLGMNVFGLLLPLPDPGGRQLWAETPPTAPMYRWELTAEHVDATRFKPLAGDLPATLTAEEPRFSPQQPCGLSLVAEGKQPQHLVVSPTLRNIKLPEKAISVAAWVQVDKPLPWGGLVGALQDNGSDEKGWLLGYRNSQFCFAINSRGSSKLTYLNAPRPFDPGIWYFVVGTYDGTEQRLYVDGALVATAREQQGDIVMPEDTAFVLGAYRDKDELYGLTGQLEQISLWNRALTEAEIQSEFQTRKTRFPDIDPVVSQVSDWPTWQRNNQRTGMSPDPLQFPLARKWTFVPRHPPAPAWPPPARQDLWNRKTNLSPRVVFDRAYHVVCAGDAVIFGSSSDDRVTCLDAETGEPRWTYFAEAPVRLAPTIVKERVLFGCDDGRVHCVHLEHGALLWRFNAFHDDRRLPGNGRMISHRPIRTGVVVEEDIAWFCAGLFPNQGVEQFAVSLQDGRLLAREVVAASPQGYLELRGGRLFIPTGRDPAGAFSSTLLRRGKTTGKEASELAQQFRHAFIGAGDVRIGGGEGIVQAMSAEDGNILWKETIEGTVWALATARGKLFVSSDSGRIDCYATPHADQKFGTVIKEQTEIPARDNPHVDAARVARWVALAESPRGWCLAATADPDWLAELARQSEWRILGIATDEIQAHQARQRLAARGLYGQRIAIHVLDAGQPLPYSDYLFNCVLGPNCFGSEHADAFPHAEFKRVLRPVGGVLWLDQTDPPAYRRDPLPGTGQWTHLYANPANTACSGDLHDYTQLQLQWFGEPGPREMIDRHHRTCAPLFAAGRLFIPGNDRVYAVDAYNGTPLWEREIPNSRRIAVFRDCSQMVASDHHLFVATADQCLVLNALTGDIQQSFPVPGNDSGKLHWGYLAHLPDADLLIGSGTHPEASRREISRDVAAKETFWDFVPLVGSTQLFALYAATGQTRWSYRSQEGLLINPTLAIADGMLWFVESGNPDTLNAANGRATANELLSRGAWLTAINAENGQVRIRQPLGFAETQHNIYLSAAQGKIVVVGSRNSGNNKLVDQVLYDIAVFNAADGALVWKQSQKQGTGIGGDHGEQDHHPVIVEDRLYCEPFGYHLHTGATLDNFLWKTKHRRGCGNISASASAFFFRENVTSMFDLDTNQVSRVTQITRPGCWINILPAGGLLLVPEASSGCSCNYAIQTSLAFLPAPPRPKPAP